MAHRPLHVRIIPARAGFTPRSVRQPAPPRDHPRSRGVYRLCRRVRGRLRGSSPLARGLPPVAPLPTPARGIIPARAGFTRWASAPTSSATDHPRSRGVYVEAHVGERERQGSSPLARGLLVHVPPVAGGTGIIPARAGFTRRGGRLRGRRADHPRSRGVYRELTDALAVSLGSSPLARGLLVGIPPELLVGRIIPARAGFTPPPTERIRVLTGSSPLARGLRLATGECRARDQDHPRSRGVYGTSMKRARWGGGSSPLARGLRRVRHHLVPGPRIIPARAGFTPTCSPTSRSRPDHPRSRGVYPGNAGADYFDGRIIPARAGFTGRRRRHHLSAPDHPRSRGVYPTGTVVPDGLVGSSPLARGLRGDSFVCVRAVRIIPARAGFTSDSRE